jgi:hypothetical protein
MHEPRKQAAGRRRIGCVRARALAGLRLAITLVAAACGSGEDVRGVVLITIDTLRADHVGCYGDRTAHTPNLDALADSGVRFETAVSPVPLTLPSHASLMTALDPPHHGIRHNTVFTLEDGIPTLATRLREAGFATAAFVGAFVLDARFGLDRGFDTLESRAVLPLGASLRPSRRLSAARALRTRRRRRRLRG